MSLVSNDPYFIETTTKAQKQRQKQGQAPSNDFQGLNQPHPPPNAGGIDPAAAFTEVGNIPDRVNPNSQIYPHNPQATTPAQQQLSELEKNQKDLESNPNTQELNPQEFFKTTYELGQRNTGIAYFDNKKDLTLLDAYIAHKLGLKTSRMEHKVDMKSDNKHRVDFVTRFADSSSKNAAWADTLIRSFGTNILNDQSNLTGAIDEKLRQILKGNFGFGEAAEQSANNNILLAIAQKSAGGSTQINQARLDLLKNEYYQADSIDKKAQVIKLHLLGIRDALVDNARRAQASGALEHAAKDIAKIKEIDAFVSYINNNDYNGIAKFLSAKTNYTPQPMADSSDRSMAEQSF